MSSYQWLTLSLLLIIAGEAGYLVSRTFSQPKRRKNGNATLVDTSVLIDGRIVAIARAGFAGSELIVPRSVVAELQYLADMADHDKRTRARHGLDVIQELQQMKHLDIKILQDDIPKDGVDAQLIRLAKRYGAQLSTIDYNLNKVAQVEGVTVLNINELAQALRISYLPGEKADLLLVQSGQGQHQAVGYLDDGTMVVVENAHRLIGREAKVEFTRNLQTQAGRMMFARLVSDSQPRKPADKPRPVAPAQPQQVSQAAKPSRAAKQPQVQPVPAQQPAQAQPQPVIDRPAMQPRQRDEHRQSKPVQSQARPQTQSVRPPRPPQAEAQKRTKKAVTTPPSPQQGRRRTSRAAEDSLISLANQK